MMERIAPEGKTDSGAVTGTGSGPQGPSGTPPAQLGEYQILREIGRGGMGVVYEAVQQSLRPGTGTQLVLL